MPHKVEFTKLGVQAKERFHFHLRSASLVSSPPSPVWLNGHMRDLSVSRASERDRGSRSVSGASQ